MYAKLATCPDCHSDERGMTLHGGGVKVSGFMYYNMGWMCLNGWHEYPYLTRLSSGHYGTRRKRKSRRREVKT